jgi:hypothetical protein
MFVSHAKEHRACQICGDPPSSRPGCTCRLRARTTQHPFDFEHHYGAFSPQFGSFAGTMNTTIVKELNDGPLGNALSDVGLRERLGFETSHDVPDVLYRRVQKQYLNSSFPSRALVEGFSSNQPGSGNAHLHISAVLQSYELFVHISPSPVPCVSPIIVPQELLICPSSTHPDVELVANGGENDSPESFAGLVCNEDNNMLGDSIGLDMPVNLSPHVDVGTFLSDANERRASRSECNGRDIPIKVTFDVSASPHCHGPNSCADSFFPQTLAHASHGPSPAEGLSVCSQIPVVPGRRRSSKGIDLDELLARKEDRRERNRLAAAKANARRKERNSQLRSDIKSGRAQVARLQAKREVLLAENFLLRRNIEPSPPL